MRLSRSIAYAASGSYVELLLGIVTSIVIARTLGAKDYGLYSLLMMWIVLTQSLVTSGIPMGVIRFVAQARARAQSDVAAAVIRYLGRVQLLKLGLALIVVATALPLYRGFGPNGLALGAIALVLAAIGFRTQYTFNVSICKGATDFRSVAIVAWVGSACNLLLVVAASAIHGTMTDGPTTFLGAYTASALIFMVVSAWASHRYRDSGLAAAIPADLSADISRHLRVVTVSALIGQLATSQIEVFFLGIWAAPEDVAYFRLGNTLAVGASGLVVGIVSGVVMPYISRSVAEGANAAVETYVRLTRYLVLLAVPVVIITAVLSKAAVVTLYGVAFSGAALTLSILTVAVALADINAPAQSYLLSANKQYLILACTISALALKLTVGALLIRQYHLAGALASLLGTTVIVESGRSWLVQRDFGARFPGRIAARSVVYSCVAAIPAAILAEWAHPVAAIMLGGGVFTVIYGFSLLIGRCLSDADILGAKVMAGHLPGRLGTVARAILERAIVIGD